MIKYDAGHYGFSLIFQMTGSVFPRTLSVACPCSLVSMVLHMYLHANAHTSNRVGPGSLAVALLGGFTSILGFAVVFRSNHAYNRWWEGGTLLLEIRGEWFNAYTTSLAFCRGYNNDTRKFQHQFARLLSLLYNCALQQITSMEGFDFELLTLDGFDSASMMFLAEAHDRVEIVFQWVQKLLAEAVEADIVGMAPPILSRVFNQLGSGMTKMNNARKISEFPMPFAFAQMLTVMLVFHSLFTIAMCALFVNHYVWAALMTFVVVGSLFGVNFIAVELEAPFGDDPNDLPLLGFMRDMNDSLIELLEKSAQTVPQFVYAPEEHDCAVTQTAGDFERNIRERFSGLDGLANTRRATWTTLTNTRASIRTSTTCSTSTSLTDDELSNGASKESLQSGPAKTPSRRTLVEKGIQFKREISLMADRNTFKFSGVVPRRSCMKQTPAKLIGDGADAPSPQIAVQTNKLDMYADAADNSLGLVLDVDAPVTLAKTESNGEAISGAAHSPDVWQELSAEVALSRNSIIL